MQTSTSIAALVALPVVQALVQKGGVVHFSLTGNIYHTNCQLGQTPCIGLELMERVRLQRRRDQDHDSGKRGRKLRPPRCRL